MSDTPEVVQLKGKVIELQKVIEGMTRRFSEREVGFYAQIRDLKARIHYLSSTLIEQNEPYDTP